ncbi:MAG: TRAP transporter small permease [Thermodesulfobacteriota bacterium]
MREPLGAHDRGGFQCKYMPSRFGEKMNVTSAILRYLGAAFIMLLTLTTGVDVVGRYFFNAPLTGGLDITVNLLTLVAGCGIAACTLAEDHITVDSLYGILSPFWQRLMRLLGYLFEFVVYAILFFQGIKAVYRSITPFFEVSISLPLPVFPFRLALAVAFLLSLVAVVCSLVRHFRSQPSDT